MAVRRLVDVLPDAAAGPNGKEARFSRRAGLDIFAPATPIGLLGIWQYVCCLKGIPDSGTACDGSCSMFDADALPCAGLASCCLPSQ